MRVRVVSVCLSFLMVLCLAAASQAQVKVITKTIRQPFGGMQSPEDARIAALARVKRRALEEAGTYIESLTVVRNGRLLSNDITAIAAGVLKTEISSEKKYIAGDAFGIEVTAHVRVDQSVLERRVRDFLNNRGALDKIQQAEKRRAELLARIKELEAENARLQGVSAEKKRKLQSEFKKASQGLTAVQWAGKGHALWENDGYTDPHKAIEYFSKAIELDPKFALAFDSLSVAYNNLNQYKRAIKESNRAIELDPNFARAYYNRAVSYHELKQYKRVIRDLNRAIELDPKKPLAYIMRGNAYQNSNQHKRSIRDYEKAIELDQKNDAAYYNRGRTYYYLKLYKLAIPDFNKAIELNPKNINAYILRGILFQSLKQYIHAIRDYDRAIELNPKNTDAYYNRSHTYYRLQKYDKACRDARNASLLGNSKMLNWLHNNGYCK